MDIAIAGAGAAATGISSSGYEGLLDLPGDLLDMLPAAVYVCDAAGLIVRCNRKAVELWGRTPKLGDREDRFCGSWRLYRLDGGPLPHEECPMADVLRTGQIVRDQEVIIERSNGSRITALVNISPLRDTAGAIVGAVNCFQDITERKRTEAVQHERERQFRELLEALPAAIYTTDAAGRITYYNQAVVDLSGNRPKLGSDEWCVTWRLYWPDGRPMPQDQCPMAVALKEDRPVRGGEAIAERPDGTRVPFIPYPTPLHDASGALVGAVNMLVDITERKQAETRLRESEARLRRLFQQAPGFMCFLHGPSHVFEFANDAYQQLIGHRDLAGKPVREALPDIEGQGYFELLDKVYRTGEAFAGRAMKVVLRRRPDSPAEERFLDFIYQPIADAEGKVSGIFIEGADVTERQRAEKARQRLAAIVESSDDAIVSKDLDGVITSWNRGAERLFGYMAEEVIGKSITILIPPDRQDEEPDILDRIRRGERIDHYETVRRRKDGSLIEISATVSPIRNGEGRIIGASKVARDITERKQAEEALRGALQDKEVLLRELQHRTKNNLQVVTSLLSLKAKGTPDEGARRDIEDVHRRVETLALVQEQLLRSHSVERVALDAYLRELCTKLVDVARTGPDKITLDLALEDITVGPDKAVPLGLIVNEIVTNSLEHAFPEGRGRLQVRLSQADDGTAVLVVADDGSGIPAEAKTGLGRGLIRGLAAQIDAELAVEVECGTRYTLTFPV